MDTFLKLCYKIFIIFRIDSVTEISHGYFPVLKLCYKIFIIFRIDSGTEISHGYYSEAVKHANLLKTFETIKRTLFNENKNHSNPLSFTKVVVI